MGSGEGAGGKEGACQCRRHKRYTFDLLEEGTQPTQYSCLENPACCNQD